MVSGSAWLLGDKGFSVEAGARGDLVAVAAALFYGQGKFPATEENLSGDSDVN